MTHKGQQELVERRIFKDANNTKVIEIEVGMVTNNVYSMKIKRYPKKGTFEHLPVYSDEVLNLP